jgi:serine-type D-Ala-D-Ala carboxypeptidase/endopeptidase (penicillin-binding protein 4)
MGSESSFIDFKLKWTFIISLLILLLTSCRTTKKITAVSGLQNEISLCLDTASVFSSGFIGLVIQDAESGENLYSRNAEKYFTPASNIKLLTLYSALKMLPDSLPALLYTENDSIIYIWGAGDPALLHPDFPESGVLHFLKEKGHKKIFFSDDNFFMPHFGAGWMWDDYRYAFQPEISPLPLYGNVAVLSAGNDSLYIFPEVFSDSVTITSDGDPFFGRLPDGNRFIIPEERLNRKSRNV